MSWADKEALALSLVKHPCDCGGMPSLEEGDMRWPRGFKLGCGECADVDNYVHSDSDLTVEGAAARWNERQAERAAEASC